MPEFITLPCVDGTEREARVLDVAEVVALEQRIVSEGISLLELMTRAGSALAQAVERAVPDGRVVVLAGSGNNSGDGWVAAAKLAKAGRGALIVAADCPSGLDAQTGMSASECIEADVTVTMLAPKVGLLEPTAQPYVGSLVLAPLVGETSASC